MWYTVQGGDSLSLIAGKYLGNVMDYLLIYEQNKAVLSRGPDYVEIGMKLWIPVDGKAKPVQTASEGFSTPTTNVAPSSGSGFLNITDPGKNKVMIAGGLGMAAIAAFLLLSK